MNTTDTNFKPTPGPWIYQKTASLGPQYAVYPESTGNDVALVYDAENAESNAALIAEAGTVYHETGKTPARLAEENRELLEALKRCLFSLRTPDGFVQITIDNGEKVLRSISKAKGAKLT